MHGETECINDVAHDGRHFLVMAFEKGQHDFQILWIDSSHHVGPSLRIDTYLIVTVPIRFFALHDLLLKPDTGIALNGRDVHFVCFIHLSQFFVVIFLQSKGHGLQYSVLRYIIGYFCIHADCKNVIVQFNIVSL